MKILFYIILFALGYRIVKKLFSPALNNTNPRNTVHQDQQQQSYDQFSGEKSGEVEDIDYEEVE